MHVVRAIRGQQRTLPLITLMKLINTDLIERCHSDRRPTDVGGRAEWRNPENVDSTMLHQDVLTKHLSARTSLPYKSLNNSESDTFNPPARSLISRRHGSCLPFSILEMVSCFVPILSARIV